MPDRFVIEEGLDDWDGTFCNNLVDNLREDVVLCDDFYERPEDATFDRGLKPLVDMMNELHDQWVEDCSALLAAAMYGNPPDPARRRQFTNEIADIERRLRDAQEIKS